MASNSKKQAQKRKARERRVRDEKIRGHREAYIRHHYPEIDFEENDADPQFVSMIKQAVQSLRLDDPSVFPKWEREFYKLVKTQGARDALQTLAAASESLVERGVGTASLMRVQIAIDLGQAVFDRINESQIARHLPHNDVQFQFDGKGILARFDSLLQARGPGGTAYYSRRGPTIEVDGFQRVVAFSRHAIERICERINPRWKTYAALGDIYSYFGNCVYFEKSDLYGGQLGFTFYNWCGDPQFWNHSYIADVLGEENVKPDGGRCYYRVGYCPAVIEGDFVKAKTLLFPGYSSTPEYGLIIRSSLDHASKTRLIETARIMDANYVIENGLSVTKWFHDHGVPQVVQMKQTVFQYD